MWYLNPALTNFRKEVNARWPNRDKTSDGTIGDADHQSRDSDHNEDDDGSVDAWDMDIDGVDVSACIQAACQHEAIQYIIYNRRITSRNRDGGLGVWWRYEGSNPHDKHVHYNTRESHENSTKPWFKDADMDMTQGEFDTLLLAALRNNTAIQREFRKLTVTYTDGDFPAGYNVRKLLLDIHDNTETISVPSGSVTDEQLKRVLVDIMRNGIDSL